MNYSVVLVQQGISAQSHPVTGKSGKLYGTAVQSAEHGGVIFQMSMQDYLENAHDVVGSIQPSQQWVPEFVPITHKAGAQKCDRCSKPAVARWDRYFYCEDHAPDNAVYLDGSGPVKKGAIYPAPTGAQPDVTPKVEERLSAPVEQERELPAEHMAAPALGSENEDRPPAKSEAGVFVPEKKQPDGEPNKPGDLTPPPEPKAEELPQIRPKNAVQQIAIATADILRPELQALVQTQIAAATKAIEHRSKKKPAKPKQPRPETEFTKLQKQAKDLGINSFGKNKEQLRSEIAAKQEPSAS